MPPRCLICEGGEDVVNGVCSGCRSQVQAVPAPVCTICGSPNGVPGVCIQCRLNPPVYDLCLSACRFEGLLQDVIHRFKYHRSTVYKRFLAGLVSDIIEKGCIEADVITYVPLHWSGMVARGYNHSALIAREVSRHRNITMGYGVLRKTKNTPSQVGLSRKEREANLKGAFTAARVEGKSVMVVDDVVTTGRTARAVSEALKRAGATRVIFVSVGRALS